MLHRLFLLLFFLGGGYLAYVAIRRLDARGRQLFGVRPPKLDAGVLRQLSRQAHHSESLKRALELRSRIWDASTQRSDRASLREHVDAAIRRLSEQEHIKTRIADALRISDQPQRSAELHPEDVEAFEEQQVMLVRLKEQARVLGRESERTLLQLSNIHLALLDVTASESVMDGSPLSQALHDLEAMGHAARDQAEAEAEVDRFISAQRRQSLDSGR